jgi:signal transduction histidine kinase
VAVLCLYPLDILVLGYASGWTLAIRAAWALAITASALSIERVSARGRRLLSLGQGVLAGVCFLGLVYFTGGRDSPYFAEVPVLPLLFAVIDGEDVRPAALCGALCAGGSLALVLVAGGGLSAGLVWVLIVAGCTFFGGYAAARTRQMQAAEEQFRLERTRREALEKLALSERRRTQSEKLATVGMLAASVMHEINNPLAFIRANVDYLELAVQRPASLDAQREELADICEEMRGGLERIRQIAADLKGLTYMDVEEPTACRLAGVVGDAARLASLRLKHVARLRVEVPEALPPVFAVPRRLTQVLLNLLVNAGDALESAQVPAAEVRVTGRVEGGRVVLLVEDDGPGFPPEVLPRLFEPFFTTKGPEKGTGLGLVLSRELVEQFGGTLTASNREEGGARLRVELPLHVSEAQAAA